MRALRLTDFRGPEGLSLSDVPEPALGPGEVRVRVRASALNRADLLQSQGRYPAPPGVAPDVPGLEYAGEVLEVGPRAERWRPGDRVMGLVGGGAWAEQVVVHGREVMALPEGLDFARAAALPEAFLTAFDALVLQAGLRGGEAVLVHAVASGVGSAAAQLCRALGARCVGTGRTAEKLARAAEWGVAQTVLVEGRPPEFARQVREATGGRGADVALDLVGGAYLPETLQALAPRGRAVLVGLVAGARAEVDLGRLLSQRLQLTGTVLRSRPPEEKMALAQAAERHLLPLFAAGALRPVVDAVLPMADARAGLERLARNDSVGKLVLAW